MLFGRDMLQNVFILQCKLPCAEFLWSASTSQKWADSLDGQLDYPSVHEMLKMFLDSRWNPPLLPPLSSILLLNGLISIGLDLQRMSATTISLHIEDHSPRKLQAKLQCILHGLETWRKQFDNGAGSVLIQPWYHRARIMYHMAYIQLNTNIHYILDCVGDTRFMEAGNSKDPAPFPMIKQELQQWVKVSASDLSTWHAVQILILYLGGPQLHEQDIYVSWCTYLATLVCWVYGELAPSVYQNAQDQGLWEVEPEDSLKAYLDTMNTGTSAGLAQLSYKKQALRSRTAGLLVVVSNVLEVNRWKRIKDGVEVLRTLQAARIKHWRTARS